MPPDVMAERASCASSCIEVEATAPDPLPPPTPSSTPARPRRKATCCGWAIRTASSIPWTCRPALFAGELSRFPPHPPAAAPPSPTGWRRAENPLTARVMVNRIWQFRMGDGLVRTPNDFGMMGDKPHSHALLDWLAAEFMDARLERQGDRPPDRHFKRVPAGSAPDEAKSKIDPENRLFWRMNRKRLEAEMIRDAALAVAGTLNPQIGGRPVRIPIEPEVYDLIFTESERDGLWPVNPGQACAESPRHLSLQQAQRAAAAALRVRPARRHDVLPGAAGVHARAAGALAVQLRASCRRSRRRFAARLEKSCGSEQAIAQIDTAWRLALARPPRTDGTRAGARHSSNPAARCRISAWRCSIETSSSMSRMIRISARSHAPRRSGPRRARLRLARASVAARSAGHAAVRA